MKEDALYKPNPIVLVGRGNVHPMGFQGPTRVEFEAGSCAEALKVAAGCEMVALIATPPMLPDGDWRDLRSAFHQLGSRASFVVCEGRYDPVTEAATHEVGAHYVVKDPKLFAYLAAHPEQRRFGLRASVP